MSLFLPTLAAFGVASAAVWLGALQPAAGLLAGAIGSLVWHGAGWPGAAGLLAFFLSGSVLSRLLETGGGRAPRTVRQVLANGGVPALGALLAIGHPGPGRWMVAAALTAATADTWATAIGTRSSRSPRHLLSGRRVARGTDGGVTFVGTVGGMVGGAFVALVVILTGGARSTDFLWLVGIGVLGGLVDSLLGEVVQGRWRCPACHEETNRPVHDCGTPGMLAGGVPWIDNNLVNAAATLFAGVSGWLAWLWLG